jgi:hypothetical protein
MSAARRLGWLVVLKTIPDHQGWIIQGSRSEYDTPCRDRIVLERWVCEMQWMGGGGKWKPSIMGLGRTASVAVRRAMSQL